MTLTEQWKKGELKEGWYYVLLFSNEEYITFIDGSWVVDDRLIGADIKEVLAPVPSFKEMKLITLKIDVVSEKIAELAVENRQLKELLDKSSHYLIRYKNNDTLPERAFYEEEVSEFLDKIDNAIGEKK